MGPAKLLLDRGNRPQLPNIVWGISAIERADPVAVARRRLRAPQNRTFIHPISATALRPNIRHSAGQA
jgi:hypothetical protein